MNYRRFLITTLTILVLVIPNTAFADMVLTVTPGLNGLYKTSQPLQLKISISNNGPAVENAVLMVKPDDQFYSEGSAIYQKKIDLPANERIETEILIPGQMVDSNAFVYLYSNNTKITSAKIQGVAVSGDFIGISIGEAPMTNGLPIWLETNLKNMLTLKYMAPTEVPSNSIALGSADLIIVDGQKVVDLTPEQLSTIREWVTLGGTLLLSGGAGAAEGQPFKDISPILANGKKVISGNWNGIRTATDPVEVTTGTFVEGEKVLTTDDTILVARRTVGRGSVVYSAVGLENLQAKDNKVWETLLQFNGAPLFAEKYRYAQENGTLLQASANFPNLQQPSVSYLVKIWGFYMVLIAPGIYLLLKKYNRRDWTWLCVPLMAVVMAAIIYYSSPMHKLNGPLGQTLAVVDVLDDRVAEIRADGSYVSPTGGVLTLVNADHGIITPRSRYNGNNLEQKPVIEYSDKGVEVNFDQVGYLSLRQASLYKVVNNFGHIEGEIKLSGNRIIGSLTNQTDMNIEKCLLVFGDNVVELGGIATNGSVNVDADVMAIKRFNWETDLQDWFNGASNTAYSIREAIATKEVYSYSEEEQNKGLQLIALVKDVPNLMQLQNADAENISSAIIRQEIPLLLPDNETFRLPSGFIPANVVESNGGLEYTPEGYMIHGGQVTVEFNLQLPVKHQQLDVQAVEISNLLVDSNYQLSIFDWANNNWVDVKPSQSRLEGDELKPFISEQKRLRLNIQRPEGQFDVMPLPGLTVEGVVK
jgi:hypothetical protein